MSETAKDRSKRVFLKHLENFEWRYQISLFYQDYRSCCHFIEDGRGLRKILSREYPNQAFLWRLCLGRTEAHHIHNAPTTYKTIVLPYHTFFTNKQLMIEELADFVEMKLRKPSYSFYAKKRSISRSKLNDYGHTVRKQRPFNLHKYAKDSDKINRFSLLNKSQVTPVWKIGMRLPKKGV